MITFTSPQCEQGPPLLALRARNVYTFPKTCASARAPTTGAWQA